MVTPNACLKIAQRMNVLLQRELAQGIDVQRMLAQPLYARDVLLVCEAMRDSDLAVLAQQYRDASVDEDPASTSPAAWHDDAGGRPSMWPPSWHWPQRWRRNGKPERK